MFINYCFVFFIQSEQFKDEKGNLIQQWIHHRAINQSKPTTSINQSILQRDPRSRPGILPHRSRPFHGCWIFKPQGTVCPRVSDQFLFSNLLYKIGHFIFDRRYFCLPEKSWPNLCRSFLDFLDTFVQDVTGRIWSLFV